jgi:hypothetical protein
MSAPPYGYIKDPKNLKRWLVDEEAATVVRRIYALSLEGLGVLQIAKVLINDRILTPLYYWESKGIKRPVKATSGDPYKWNDSTVTKILTLQEYCGDVINFKTYSKSYKNKKRLENPEENRAIFMRVHEAIIDRPTWEKVQAKRGTRKKVQKLTTERSIFSTMLKCADCGSNLHFRLNQKKPGY